MEDKKAVNDTKSEGNLHPKTIGRAAVLLGVAVLLFSALLVRIFLLQTVKYDYYRQKVLAQITTESSVNASRGNIYDANGMLLATNVTTYRVFISPSSIARAQSKHDQKGSNIRLDTLISENLSQILNVSYDYVLKQTTYTKYLDRTIAREVDEDTADLVRAFIDEYELEQMIYLESSYTRHYPYSSLASHVLGFTGSDGTGLYGLEFQYNQMLCGTNGRYVTARDSSGNEMPYAYKEYIPAQNGYNVNTTIDVFVQSALEEQLKNAYLESGGENRAAGIVMNVKTGAVLGMAVYPNFNLNSPRDLDEQSLSILQSLGYEVGSDAYNSVKQNLQLTMWSNKAITESYIPGSTFKVMTASMALEEDVVTLGESHTCVGSFTVLGQKIHCHKVQGHGALTFAEGIQQSCNPWLMKVGLRLGTNTFYNYLKAFGYLEKTGIDLPGEGGGVFAAQGAFTDLDLAIYAFGQNFNVTLIQQITAVSAVANGGYLVTPHFVSSITDENGNVIQSFDNTVRRQVVSQSVCETVAKILEEGVSGNGGAKNAYVAGYRLAAKTGTSEKKERECPLCGYTATPATIEGVGMFVCTVCQYTGTPSEFKVSEKYVCSTVAFAPADDPQYAIIIMVDEPTKGTLYGSVVAAPYVANVMETILPYLGVEAVYTEKELEKMAIKIPSFVGWTVSAARNYCKNNGLEIEIVGADDGIIRRQYPEKDVVVEKSSARILAYTDKDTPTETVQVPDVTGMSAVAANQVLINAGLNIRILGTKNYLSGTGATVVSQSIAAGEVVPKGTCIEVTFRYLDDKDYDNNWETLN
ncbi:MAG: PASTA domain-containing protein [Clostridia bacterium]|nr:PASTA domain-containing protein [Clostridia bacterium]